MEADGGQSGERASRRSRRWDAAVLVGLASVLVTLVFNSIQAKNSADQLKATADANAYSTFFDLHQRVIRTDAAVVKAYLRQRANQPVDYPAALDAAAELEGLAEYVKADPLDQLHSRKTWGQYLSCDYQWLKPVLARKGVSIDAYAPTLKYDVTGRGRGDDYGEPPTTDRLPSCRIEIERLANGQR